jgi:hypothetical protein
MCSSWLILRPGMRGAARFARGSESRARASFGIYSEAGPTWWRGAYDRSPALLGDGSEQPRRPITRHFGPERSLADQDTFGHSAWIDDRERIADRSERSSRSFRRIAV